MSSKMKTCKTCNESIAKSAKKCPKCGAKNKSKKGLIVLAIIVLIGAVAALSGGGEPKVEYVKYNYGDIIKKENTVADSKYKVIEGLTIKVEEQIVLSKEEILEANPFNTANNSISVIKVTFENNSKESISYNRLGFSFVTESGVQLDDSFGSLAVLPESLGEAFGSGDLMPGSKFTRYIDVEIPDGDKIKRINYDYFDTKFLVELN